jgi:hypothetical protein
MELFAMVNEWEMKSSSVGYLGTVCGGDITGYQATTNVVTTLNNFDFLVIRYRNNSGGTDLDTFTGFIDNALPIDVGYGNNTNWVGFSGTSSAPLINYLKWAGDNTSAGGVEAVLIDFKKLIEDYPTIGEVVKVRLHGWWYSNRTTGAAQIELETWLGGVVPVQAGFDFTKSDGVVVNHLTLNTNVTCLRAGQIVNVACAQRLGELVYNKENKTATLTSMEGGCDCGNGGTQCNQYTNLSENTLDIGYTDCNSNSFEGVFIGPGQSFCCFGLPWGNDASQLTLVDTCD